MKNTSVNKWYRHIRTASKLPNANAKACLHHPAMNNCLIAVVTWNHGGKTQEHLDDNFQQRLMTPIDGRCVFEGQTCVFLLLCLMTVFSITPFHQVWQGKGVGLRGGGGLEGNTRSQTRASSLFDKAMDIYHPLTLWKPHLISPYCASKSICHNLRVWHPTHCPPAANHMPDRRPIFFEDPQKERRDSRLSNECPLNHLINWRHTEWKLAPVNSCNDNILTQVHCG